MALSKKQTGVVAGGVVLLVALAVAIAVAFRGDDSSTTDSAAVSPVADSTAEGGARWADLPVFEPTAGAWSVTPLVEAETTLHTAGNYLDRDIVVEAIPYAEVSNPTGGMTATIGG